MKKLNNPPNSKYCRVCARRVPRSRWDKMCIAAEVTFGEPHDFREERIVKLMEEADAR